ncbi:MAG TPA: hypothetical protein VMU92_05045 [Acidobacteriaceae bacterium]|nr:hypothetical protein [Acidobacteriaceae bacterium]
MRISKGQIAYLGNTLYEVLHSFNVEDFYFAVGSSREAVEGLANLLEEHYIACRDQELRELHFSNTESLILRNASMLCSENFSREEFQSRLGESPESARRFIRQIEPAEETPALHR